MRRAAAGGHCPTAPAPLLLVEDSAPLRQMLSWDLADLGYAVSAAGDCAEARRLAERHQFRFALLDVRLPDGDGRTLAAELSVQTPTLRIVLMSGDPGARAPSPPAGGVIALLAKPVDSGIIHWLLTTATAALQNSAVATDPS